MTRKRFKKLLMSQGVSRDNAEFIIDIIVASQPSTKFVHGFGCVSGIEGRVRYGRPLFRDQELIIGES